MSRGLTLSLLLVVLVSVSTATIATAEVTGMVGGGIGTVDNVGTPLRGESFVAQLFTVNGLVVLFPSPWWAIVGDVTIGLNHTYEGFDGGGTQEIEISAVFVDGLGALYKKFTGDGFLYFGAGLTLASADATTTETPSAEIIEADFDTSVGIVFGAGGALPITDNVLGFITLRQRFLTSEATLVSNQSGFEQAGDVSIGGLEVSAGIGFEF